MSLCLCEILASVLYWPLVALPGYHLTRDSPPGAGRDHFRIPGERRSEQRPLSTHSYQERTFGLCMSKSQVIPLVISAVSDEFA